MRHAHSRSTRRRAAFDPSRFVGDAAGAARRHGRARTDASASLRRPRRRRRRQGQPLRRPRRRRHRRGRRHARHRAQCEDRPRARQQQGRDAGRLRHAHRQPRLRRHARQARGAARRSSTRYAPTVALPKDIGGAVRARGKVAASPRRPASRSMRMATGLVWGDARCAPRRSTSQARSPPARNAKAPLALEARDLTLKVSRHEARAAAGRRSRARQRASTARSPGTRPRSTAKGEDIDLAASSHRRRRASSSRARARERGVERHASTRFATSGTYAVTLRAPATLDVSRATACELGSASHHRGRRPRGHREGPRSTTAASTRRAPSRRAASQRSRSSRDAARRSTPRS